MKWVASGKGGQVADEVDGDHAIPRGCESRDEVAVEVRAGRVAVHEQNGGTVARDLIDVADADRCPVGIVDSRVVRLEVVVLKALEAFVRRAKHPHIVLSSSWTRAITARSMAARARGRDRP